MRYIKRFINNNESSFLELTVYDEEDINFITTHLHEKNIAVSMDMLKYLSYFPKTKNLVLMPGFFEEKDLLCLYKLKELQSLIIDYENVDGEFKYQIDLSKFPHLEYLFSKRSDNFCNLEKSNSMRSLTVLYWAQKNLEIIKECKIDTLCIFNGKLVSLQGLKTISTLVVLSLHNLKIQAVEEINQLKKIKILEIENCNKINITDLENPYLEYFIFSGNTILPNIEFIKKLVSLKRIILDVKIENGDISILQTFQHAVILTDRKNFNLKNNQLPKSNIKYSIDFIPQWRYYFNDRRL